MTVMLDNGKILDDELSSKLAECKNLFVFQFDENVGRAVASPLTAWDGENIVLYKNKHEYELGAALDVVPVPDIGAPGYLMMTHSEFNGIFVGSYSDFIVASHARDGKGPFTLDFDEACRENEKSQVEALERYGLSIAYDARLDKRFREKRFSGSPDGEAWAYKGNVPERIQRILFANIAVSDADRFYKSPIFDGGAFQRAVTRYSHAATLMESLTLGFECRPYPEYSETDSLSAWRESTIKLFLFDADYTHSPNLAELVDGYRFYANLSILWEEIASALPVRLAIDGNFMRSPKKCNEALEMLGKAIDAHSYVNAYTSGVPLEDILA